MKVLGIFVVALTLTACAPYMTLEELEDQAMLTGDWSAVETRERQLQHKAKREAQRRMQCPAGQSVVCLDRFGSTTCGCADRHEIWSVFSRR